MYAEQHGNMLNIGIKSLMVNKLEEPLPAGGSCLLGSINLSEFVINPFKGKDSVLNRTNLVYTVKQAIRALTEVLVEGLPKHPLKEQREAVGGWRQIGLGTLGLGDMMLKMGIKYGSAESLELIEEVYRLIAYHAVIESLSMAREYGAFPNCTDEIKNKIAESDFIKALHLSEPQLADIRKYGLYHSQLLTCAPTGSIGTMLQCSTGVEPNFAFTYERRTVSLNDKETVYFVDAKIAKDYKKTTGESELPDYFISAEEIPYKDRIAVQAMLQRYIDASISSTVNLSNETTVEEVADLYIEAWKQGLKGITIWRNGCARQAILSTGTAPKKEDSKETEDKKTQTDIFIKKVSDDCVGRKRTLQTGCGTLHLTAFFDRKTGQLLETYFSKGSQGGCAQFMVGLSRMTSLCARAGVPIGRIVDQLQSSGTCPSYAVRRATKQDTSKGSSCPVAIGHALLDMYNEYQRELDTIKHFEQPHKATSSPDKNDGPRCPECGEVIVMTEGCMTCPSCGYSKCS